MPDVNKALETQLRNIQSKTGKTLDELSKIVKKTGLTKHGEIRERLKRDLSLGHGDANSLVHYVLKSDGKSAAQAKSATPKDVISEIYSGAKDDLRPIHDKLMAAIEGFGPFEIAPKKGYISLRRKKQFAMIGPATKTRVEVGLNIKGLTTNSRLKEMPPASMCQYKVAVTDPQEVDKELIDWIKRAYESAG